MARRYKDWHNPPPVSVIGGTDDFYRRRALRKAILAATMSGRRVERCSSLDHLGEVLSGASVFVDPALAILTLKPPKKSEEAAGESEDEVPEKKRKPRKSEAEALLDFIGQHLGTDDNQVAVVVLYEGAVPAAVVDAIPKTYRFVFDTSPGYKLGE